METFETTVRLRHTDAAGVVFFARWFELAHEVYERFLGRLGHPLPADLARAPVILPIAHAEADYRRPARLGDRLAATLVVERVGSRAFTLLVRFADPSGDERASVRTVHVAVDGATGRPTALPADLRAALS